MANIGIIIESPSYEKAVIDYCNSKPNELYYLGQLFHPDVPPVGLPEHEAILMELFGRPQFNRRKSPVECVPYVVLDDLLYPYTNKVFYSCKDNIDFVYSITPYYCQSAYGMWWQLLMNTQKFIYLSCSNLFNLYIDILQPKQNHQIHSTQLLSFFIFIEGFRTFIYNCSLGSKKEVVDINDRLLHKEINIEQLPAPNISSISNMLELVDFFADTEWAPDFPDVAPLKKQRESLLISKIDISTLTDGPSPSIIG